MNDKTLILIYKEILDGYDPDVVSACENYKEVFMRGVLMGLLSIKFLQESLQDQEAGQQ